MTAGGGGRRTFKILYLAGWPMNKRDWDRFGVSHFVRSGHRVEIANLADCVYPSLEKPWNEEVRDPKTPVHRITGFRSLLRLRRMFARFDAAVVLLQSAHLMPAAFIPYFLLGRSGCPYAVTGPVVYPGALLDAEAAPFRRRLRDFFMRIRKANLFNSVIARLPASWLGVRPAAVVLRQSENSGVDPAFTGPGTRVLKSCTDDYENLMRLRRGIKESKPQAVFIDQYMPHHPDLAELKAPQINAEDYYKCLHGYLSRFDAETGLQTVVAVHPRAPLKFYEDVMRGRPAVKNRLAELAAESRVLLGHTSTALGMAAPLRLPVVLLTTKPLYHRYFYEKYYYEMFSRELGAPLIFIDNPETAPVPALADLTVSEDLCAAYEKRYLRCEGAPETPRWAAVEAALHEVLAA